MGVCDNVTLGMVVIGVDVIAAIVVFLYTGWSFAQYPRKSPSLEEGKFG